MRRRNNTERTAVFHPRSDRLYLAFYKPYGYLSQFTQPQGSEKRTLAEFCFPPDVYPVGRLDWDSEGLLILSDDGALNHALLDPQFKHQRAYLAQVENIPSQTALRKLETGIVIDGKKTLPARASLLSTEPQLPPRAVPIRFRQNIPTAWIKLTLTEGRNRQVRRMTAAIGHPTLRLLRESIGKLRLADLNLPPGQWCELTKGQVLAAFGD